MKRILFLLLSASLLVGCASSPDNKTATAKSSGAEKIYQEAKAAEDTNNYRNAIELYEALEARFPFSPYAIKAQLNMMEAYMEISEPESSIAAAERFIRLHGQHPDVDKAYYYKALAMFKMNWSFVQKIVPVDMSKRDQKLAREAFYAFSELVHKYPRSQYVKDARKRMLFLRNQLASHEVGVARYYYDRKEYIAASKRARYVVEHYPRTPAVNDALEIQIKAYTELELHDLANAARKVLELNSTKQQAQVLDKPSKES